MANSFVRYTGNGSNRAYAINFSYRSTDDLSTLVAGSAVTAYVLDSAGTTLTFDVAPANGAAIEIRRTTSQTAKLVDYVSGSVLTENDLDTDSDQSFYMSQEALDKAGDVIVLDSADFNWDGQSKRLKNIATPVDNTDAVNKAYISTNIPNITTVAGISANVTAVAGNATNINAVAADATDIGLVATNIGSVNTVAADITKVIAVANDLAEAVSEVETVANDLNEATSEIDTVATSITNVDAVGTNIANVNTVAGVASDVTTVAGISADVAAVENIAANVTTVAGISANVTSVAGISSEISAVNANATNINTVAGANTNINNVGGSIASVNTVATNLASVNSFANTYLGASSSAPTLDPDGSALDVGDLYFDTSSSSMKVYSSGGWINSGSSVNGTSNRFSYTATAGQTTFTGADANGNTLAYDAGYVDIFLNGIKIVVGTDVTATSGTSAVLATGATVNDTLELIAYGTFTLANFSITDANDVPVMGTSGQSLVVNSGGTALEFSTPTSSINDLSDTPASLGTAGQVLKVNSGANGLEYGQASSAEVYGFNKNSSGQLIVTTTNQGVDNITNATFATFDDVLFSASGFVFSISNGDLISTI